MATYASLEQQANAELTSVHTIDELDSFKVKYFGKKGVITLALKGLSERTAEERKRAGAELNAIKAKLLEVYASRAQQLQEAQTLRALEAQKVDVTLPSPSVEQNCGRLHPNTLVFEAIHRIFGRMGFKLAEGPDIEDDEHNFTALNFPDSHPAREMHDTFFLETAEGVKVLRTHTSPVQIRVMRSVPPPIRVICPGRTYRYDSDQTHTPMFHQVEGLVVDQNVNLSHMRWVLETFCKEFFDRESLKLRFRPSFFPFTEPSLEVDIQCTYHDNHIVIGEGDQWLEILGCGMVHENVLKNCGYDPNSVQGFAFGIGIDRLAMLKFGIADLRSFFETDLRWLAHYGLDFLSRL